MGPRPAAVLRRHVGQHQDLGRAGPDCRVLEIAAAAVVGNYVDLGGRGGSHCRISVPVMAAAVVVVVVAVVASGRVVGGGDVWRGQWPGHESRA